MLFPPLLGNPLDYFPPLSIDAGLGISTHLAARRSTISRDGAAMELPQWLHFAARATPLGHLLKALARSRAIAALISGQIP
jgi:hypothetical protein